MTTQRTLLTAFLLILSITSMARAQAPAERCTLKLADLPAASELMGFKMGMTTEQVKARVPQIAFGHTDGFGTSKTTINPDFDPKIDKASFQGVRSVSLDFLDSRLTSLWLGYDSTFKWHTIDDFVKGISASLHLPNAWESWRSRGRQLRCTDFFMTVTTIADGPSFRIVDQTADDQLAARRLAKEEQESEAAESEHEEPSIVGDAKNKIYYTPECAPLKPIIAGDQVAFKSVEEAEKAGYKRSKNCGQ
jgi:hypothetical protein